MENDVESSWVDVKPVLSRSLTASPATSGDWLNVQQTSPTLGESYVDVTRSMVARSLSDSRHSPVLGLARSTSMSVVSTHVLQSVSVSRAGVTKVSHDCATTRRIQECNTKTDTVSPGSSQTVQASVVQLTFVHAEGGVLSDDTPPATQGPPPQSKEPQFSLPFAVLSLIGVVAIGVGFAAQSGLRRSVMTAVIGIIVGGSACNVWQNGSLLRSVVFD